MFPKVADGESELALLSHALNIEGAYRNLLGSSSKLGVPPHCSAGDPPTVASLPLLLRARRPPKREFLIVDLRGCFACGALKGPVSLFVLRRWLRLSNPPPLPKMADLQAR